MPDFARHRGSADRLALRDLLRVMQERAARADRQINVLTARNAQLAAELTLLFGVVEEMHALLLAENAQLSQVVGELEQRLGDAGL